MPDCRFFIFPGKTEGGCAAPSAAKPAVWSHASSEGDQQMSGVQVSTQDFLPNFVSIDIKWNHFLLYLKIYLFKNARFSQILLLFFKMDLESKKIWIFMYDSFFKLKVLSLIKSW